MQALKSPTLVMEPSFKPAPDFGVMPILPCVVLTKTPVNTKPGGEFRILAVDDEEHELDTLNELLSKPGRKVIKTTSPEKALTLFDSERPDCVIADYKFPEQQKTGLDVVYDIREKITKNVRVGFAVDEHYPGNVVEEVDRRMASVALRTNQSRRYIENGVNRIPDGVRLFAKGFDDPLIQQWVEALEKRKNTV